MSNESVGSCSSFLQPRRLFQEYPEQNLQIDPAKMNNPFSSPPQQEGHFRNSVSDGVSSREAVSVPSDRAVIPMTIAQNTHGVVYSPSSSCGQDGNFNICQPTKVRISQNTPGAVTPDGYNGNKCFISGAGGSGPPDRQAMMTMNGEDVPKIPSCPCGGGTCIVLTSRTEKNPNRRFYKCPAKIKCNFFQWCDELGQSSQSPLKPSQGYGRSPSKIIKPQNTPSEPKKPTCSCKAGPCIVQAMHQGENKGRKYYACSIKKGQGACNHFEWVDSPVKPPETESNSKRNQNNISIVDVTTPEPKQTLSPYESVKDLFGENDMKNIDFWCKGQDPNSTAATGNEISKQLSPGKRPHQPNTMGEISPMKRLNLSDDAFLVVENCRNCGKRGQCIECPILTCFKDDDFSENKHGNAMDGGNISTLAIISPIKGTSLPNTSPGSLKRAGKCFNCGKEGHWRSECTAPGGTNSACFKCSKVGHWMKNCNL